MLAVGPEPAPPRNAPDMLTAENDCKGVAPLRRDRCSRAVYFGSWILRRPRLPASERHGQLILDCRSQASPSPGIPTWSMVWRPIHDSRAWGRFWESAGIAGARG